MVMLAGPSPWFISFINSHLTYINYFYLFLYIYCFVLLFNYKTKLTLLILSVAPSLLIGILLYFYYQSNEISLNIFLVLGFFILIISTTIGNKKGKKINIFELLEIKREKNKSI